MLRPRSSKVSVQKVVLCPFHSRARPSGVTLESAGLKNYPPSSGKSSRSWSKLRWAYGGLAYSFTLKVKWSYISAQKLKSERSKSFAVSILLQTKDVGGQFRFPGTGKYAPSSGKFNRSWSKSRCAYGGLGYSFSLKVKWGNISAQKLESDRLKSYALCI